MNIALTRNEWLSKSLAIAIAIICFVAHYYTNDGTLIFKCCLLICGVLLARSIKHKYLFVVLLVISSYVILLFPYFINNLSIGTFSALEQTDLYQKTIYVFSVFLVSLLFFFKDVPYVPIMDRIPVFENDLIYYFNAIAMIAILIFGASGQSVLEAAYGEAQHSMSIVYVYFPIFFLASFVSSGRHKRKLIFLILMGGIFAVRSLLFGARGNTVSILMMMYILFFDKRLSFKGLLVFIVAGFTFLGFWAQYRMGIRGISLSDIYNFGANYNNKYAAEGNNQTDVFYASVRLISLKDMGLISGPESLQAFALFWGSIFVPYSILPPLANLSMYLISSFSTLGGGLIFSYFYVYLSYFGVILIAYYVSTIFRKLRQSTNLYMLFYGILACCTVIGWFAYGPITLFKLCLLGTCYVFVLRMISKRFVKP
jgi:hypothetical protein